MVKIETQGLSVDYNTATGQFDPIDRGELSKAEILAVLSKLIRLRTPDASDSCPPSVNVQLSEGEYSCFYGDAGVIRCADSPGQGMTAEVAASIICGELTIGQYDAAQGHQPAAGGGVKLGAIVALVLLCAAVYLIST